MHRAFHMLTLIYLLRLISTTCSNSNNPSAPQEPTICWSCHFFTILTPTFLLTKAWATIRVLSLCTSSVLLILSQVITLTEQRGCCGGLEESILRAPSTILKPAGEGGFAAEGSQMSLSLSTVLSQWSHFTKARPHPLRQPTSWSVPKQVQKPGPRLHLEQHS